MRLLFLGRSRPRLKIAQGAAHRRLTLLEKEALRLRAPGPRTQANAARDVRGYRSEHLVRGGSFCLNWSIYMH
ncbi:hypothetical protein WJX81_000643 [Elliptochloris bilobata]|uniref:Uncharacterized protein n=1 Tax=Elliptochloris bilobata TaxID=381761 RepID=A0AAW1RXG1_9CHLO